MPQSCPYCGHYALSTDHLHRHSPKYPSGILSGDRLCRLWKGWGNGQSPGTDLTWRFLMGLWNGSLAPWLYSLWTKRIATPWSGGNAQLWHFHQESGSPNTIVHPTKVKESSNGAKYQWVDWNPSDMNYDSRRYWSVVLRPSWKPARAWELNVTQADMTGDWQWVFSRHSLSSKLALLAGNFPTYCVSE